MLYPAENKEVLFDLAALSPRMEVHGFVAYDVRDCLKDES
jgi:hypothetical protein